MANRVFQNVVYQMKDAVDRVVGVIDETGTVISCSELGQIGEVREGVATVRQTAGDAFVRDGYAYHQFSNAKHNDYAVFVEGTDTTAEQFAAMLYRFAQEQGYDVSIGENTNILSYTDVADLSEYAISAMQWAVGAGIINGTGDGSTLTPQGQATRAQAAVMLTRFCEEYVTW